MLSYSATGKAGELRVASELLLRGHVPLLSVVDEGIDITLTTGPTIQVKACNTTTVKNTDKKYYVFTMHSTGARRPDGSRVKRHRMLADFAVFWCIPDMFFIVPREKIGQRHTINIPADDGSKCMWNEYQDRWDLLEGPD